MRKKTIGEVLRLARINQGLSLEELQRKTDIQLDLLEALESDDFDKLPSPFYARSFLRKYAWAVELDENIVLDAYDSGSMITYEEVDVDERELSGRRRSNRKKRSFLPLFYFILFSLSLFLDRYAHALIFHLPSLYKAFRHPVSFRLQPRSKIIINRR